LKTQKRLDDEQFTYFYECEIKQLTQELTKFHNWCEENDLTGLELEIECVNFIIGENKRFILKSKNAQFLYNLKNARAASSVGY